ncbi:MAG: inositol monophosphatase [Actinobacteria bacterium]|nr:inositol monophosphatase [Actinomycetota bacterium]
MTANFAAFISFGDNGTMSSACPTDLAFARDIVRQAGEFTLRYFRSTDLTVDDKSDGSPVTAADRGAEQLLRELIAERFPDDTIQGEEFEDRVGTSGRTWIIDPIDGTKAFTRGVVTYTNLLYLEDETGPAVGIINIPALGEMVSAGRGLGAYLNDEPCHVNDRDDVPSAVLSCSGFDYWDPKMLMSLRDSGFQMRTWGDGYGYALVATGRIEAMVDPIINYWDIAPCTVIIPEAGGRFTTTDGTDDPALPSFVATNGVLHDAVIKALNGGD